MQSTEGIRTGLYGHLHFCTLVCAISLLLSDQISEDALVRAERLLVLFYRCCEQLYGECFLTAVTMS